MDTNGAVSTRPEHGASHGYGTLALEGLTGDPAVAGPLESGDDPEETGTEEVDKVDTEDPGRQRAPHASDHTEVWGGNLWTEV